MKNPRGCCTKTFILTVGFILILPIFLFSANQQMVQGVKNIQTQKEMVPLEERINQLRTEMKKEIEFQQQMIQTSFGGVSKQLAAVTLFFSIVATITALFAIGIGIYITTLANKMIKISQEAQDVLRKSESVKAQVDQLNEMIKNNLSKLYEDIKEEETRYIINRLKKEPKDITNFQNTLVSRDLSNEYYADLKACYLSLPREPTYNNYTIPYIILFFQHYAGLAFFDPQLADSLKSNYYIYSTSAFKNDILNTTRDLVKGCVDHDFHEEGRELIKYLNVLKQHTREEVVLEDIFGIVWEGLISRGNRFGFYQMIPDDDFYKDLKKFHGKKLLEDYGTSSNSETENLILVQVKELLATTEVH